MTKEEEKRLLAIFHVWSIMDDILVSIRGFTPNKVVSSPQRHDLTGVFDGYFDGLVHLHKGRKVQLQMNDIKFVKFEQKTGIKFDILLNYKNGCVLTITTE